MAILSIGELALRVSLKRGPQVGTCTLMWKHRYPAHSGSDDEYYNWFVRTKQEYLSKNFTILNIIHILNHFHSVSKHKISTNGNLTEIRLHPRVYPEPFQPGTPSLFTYQFQANPCHCAHRVASIIERIDLACASNVMGVLISLMVPSRSFLLTSRLYAP